MNVDIIHNPTFDVLHQAKIDLNYLKNMYDTWSKYYNKESHVSILNLNNDKKLVTFLQNLEQVVNHNSNIERKYTLSMNQYADMTSEEFEQQYLLKLSGTEECSATATKKEKTKLRVNENDDDDLPQFVDWRTTGYVTPVKNQGHCGSCWSHSAVAAMEFYYKKLTGVTMNLSEQQLVDCAQNFDNHGCSGGLPSHAFEYVKEIGGIEKGESYPYHAVDETCKFSSKDVAVHVIGSVNLTQYDERELLLAVARVGAVSIAFQVVGDFRLYSSGVYESTTCGNKPSDVNHAVLAVGYGNENGTPYWIVKNSWGPAWGDQGFFKIKRGVNMCGVAVCNSYPIVGRCDTDDESPVTTTDTDYNNKNDDIIVEIA